MHTKIPHQAKTYSYPGAATRAAGPTSSTLRLCAAAVAVHLAAGAASLCLFSAVIEIATVLVIVLATAIQTASDAAETDVTGGTARAGTVRARRSS